MVQAFYETVPLSCRRGVRGEVKYAETDQKKGNVIISME